MPKELWSEGLYGIEYKEDVGSGSQECRWFDFACQIESGCGEFHKIDACPMTVVLDPATSNEKELQERVLAYLKRFAKRYRKIYHLAPDIKFKAVETDPPPERTQEPDWWRQRYEETFEGGLSIEWNAGARHFWMEHQSEIGSEDYVGEGDEYGFDPGCDKEQIVKLLRKLAKGRRKIHRLDPGIRFKFVEENPYAPDEQSPRFRYGPRTEPPPRPERRLARCGQCEHVFVKDVAPDTIIECERCSAKAVWQFVLPDGSECPATGAGKHKLHVGQLKSFTGRSFEQFLGILFENIGFSVEETPATTDQGADLILTVPSGQRIAVQAKRYNQDVGNAAVQEIMGGMAYWECDTGIVVSASRFTRAAKDLAKKAPNVILWDKPVLEVLIDRYLSQVVVFVAEKQPASEPAEA
jgi:hypothetical protein